MKETVLPCKNTCLYPFQEKGMLCGFNAEIGYLPCMETLESLKEKILAEITNFGYKNVRFRQDIFLDLIPNVMDKASPSLPSTKVLITKKDKPDYSDSSQWELIGKIQGGLFISK